MPPEPLSLAARLTSAPPLADPKRARARLAEALASLPDNIPFRDLLLALADHSPFLWRLAVADPARLARLANTPPENTLRALCAEQSARHRAFPDTPRENIARAFRLARAEHALLVALADLGGVWSVEEVTAALSAFADASVAGAVGVALQEAAAQGRLTLPNPDEPAEGCGFVVLALGKHGAGELNYSSDIDLVVFFDPDTAPLAPGAEGATVYTRIAQSVARLLGERTPNGYVHRVDYRLRPDPASTPTAVALPSAYTYYETVGQNWERAAFIKARPVAGDLTLGERFLAELVPFVWRKYFDFAAIADVHAMKRQIHAVRGHDEIAVAGHDIKLGRGGIREIEFFVQTQQLVFGGRRPALRGRRTLDMLRALHDESWITAKARDELTDAYRFLRTIEHRLQMVADEQTQRLPSDPETLKRFAKFCGFRTLPAFAKVLTGHARRVQAHYALLFEEGPELASDLGSLVFTGTSDDPETLATLKRLGFTRPEAAAETVRGWHFGRRPAVVSARAREVLTELTPALLAALGGSADPDGALANLDRAFGRMPAAVELLVILHSHDRLRVLFADILGTAPRLAETVAQAPHVLDALIDPAFVAATVNEAEIEAQTLGLLGTPRDHEDFLDRLRDAARQMRFVAGARLLSEIQSPPQSGEAYSAIAHAAIRAAFDQVRPIFEAEHGRVPGGRMAVLGLGRLGSRELTADSDLDLVALYDYDPADRESDGPRRLDAVVYFTRLTQRLVAALTAPTRRGRLYDVDLRLRPQGGKGPVASHFPGWVAYQRDESELWEKMALTRARPLAGDPSLLRDAAEAVAAILSAPRDPAAVAREVRAMRELIAREKGDGGLWDVKLAPGGLTDLEFLAQALTLSHASVHPALLGLPPAAVLAEAGRLGLVAPADAATLGEAHALLTDLLHWQRLTIEGRFDPAAVPPAILKRLAAVAGLPSAAALEARMAELRGRVRAIFTHVLDPLSPRAGKGSG